jgi:hypothetical protein
MATALAVANPRCGLFSPIWGTDGPIPPLAWATTSVALVDQSVLEAIGDDRFNTDAIAGSHDTASSWSPPSSYSRDQTREVRGPAGNELVRLSPRRWGRSWRRR